VRIRLTSASLCQPAGPSIPSVIAVPDAKISVLKSIVFGVDDEDLQAWWIDREGEEGDSWGGIAGQR